MAEAGGQERLRLLLEEGDRLPHADARHRHGGEGRGVQLVVLAEGVRLGRGRDGDDRRQRYRLAARGRDVVLRQHVGRQALRARHLRDHLVGAPAEAEAVDVVLAQQRRQRIADRLHGEAEIVGLRAVDGEADDRVVVVEVAVGDDEEPALARRVLDLLHRLEHGLVAAGRADHHLHRQAAGRTRQRRQREGEHAHAVDSAELALDQRLQDLGRAVALGPRLQDHAGEALVRSVGAVDDEAGVGLRERLEDAVHLLAIGVGIIEVGVLRRLAEREDDALVLFRRQLGADMGVEEIEAAEHGDREQGRHRPVVEGRAEPPAVPAGEGGEGAVDEAREPPLGHFPRQQQRAHHRRQRHRDDARDDHRSRQREGELAKQRAGEPAEEADGRIDGGQRDGHGGHRPQDLAGADHRRLHGRAPGLDVAVDVLHHDDGVVDHQPDGEHHGQQRQQVEAEAEGEHDRGRADQR